MQINNQQDISFKRLLATPEVQATKGFQKAKKSLLAQAKDKDIFINLATNTEEITPYIGKPRQEKVQRFKVIAKTLLGDISSLPKESQGFSDKHLEETTKEAVQELTQKLFEHHAPKPEPKRPLSKEELAEAEKVKKQMESFFETMEKAFGSFGKI